MAFKQNKIIKCTNDSAFLIGKRARHYQRLSWYGICIYTCIYIYMEVRVPNSSACHAYVMWAELGHCHFLYVLAVSNVVTTGNGTGTKNV